MPDHQHVIDRDAVVALGPPLSGRLGIRNKMLEFRVRQLVADNSGGDFANLKIVPRE